MDATIHSSKLQHPIQKNNIEPYRVFFPLGIVLGLLGVGVWPIYALGWIEGLRSIWHIDLQLQGFLFAFILGFLLTALPNFSMTQHAQKSELVFFGILFLGGNLATILSLFSLGRVAFAINMLALVVFAAGRFRKRQSDPPPEFVFVGAGLLMGIVAAVFRALGLVSSDLAGLDIVGRRILAEGMVTMLVLGIGGKLVPMIWGMPGGAPLVQLGSERRFTPRHRECLVLALLYCATFLFEYLASERHALWVRAIIATIVFIRMFRFHRRGHTAGILVAVIRISTWLTCLALWGSAIHPRYRVDVLHILFIGGFAMLILPIASRVILAHGGYSTEIEARSKTLAIAAILLGASLVLRIAAFFTAEHHFRVLGAAGIAWLVGLAV
ncbi:MAG TPA: NnrS family protein, partial [Candidatus Krumholzibacteria bacterium]|nr:NnrS family protein [Candidatus Krumholzibacteria bacterium]